MSVLLLAHVALLAWSDWWHSPTANEPGHLAAGISHWQLGSSDLYRVNPPLVRMTAALPVLAAGVETDWSRLDSRYDARPVFVLGEDLVRANGARSFWLFTMARWACIPFSLVGAMVCFCWARELYGARAGTVALILWCFSPNVIAHASLITPDAAAAAMAAAACYSLWRWLKRPTWRRAALAGVVLGVAECTKLTLILFYPLWPVLWIAFRLAQPGRPPLSRWVREGAMLVAQLVIAVWLINQVYGFDGSCRRLGDYAFVSGTFRGPGSNGSFSPTSEERGTFNSANRFAGTWLGRLPVPLPENYLLGIDFQRRDFERFGNPSYLRGRLNETGWWYYYLYALGVKVPLGTWGLLLAVLALRGRRKLPAARGPDEMVLLGPALAILAFVSSQTGFSLHLRYALPILPFLFVWISNLARLLEGRFRGTAAICGSLLIWSVTSSLWVFPHSLSYFNELAGGPTGGHAHLIHSNLDWGQDLLYLKGWLDRHPEARPLYLACYTGFDPRYAGLEFRLPPSASKAPGTGPVLPRLSPGCYAISASFLRGYPWGAADGKGQTVQFERDAFSYFLGLDHVATAGYSIHIYWVAQKPPLGHAPD